MYNVVLTDDAYITARTSEPRAWWRHEEGVLRVATTYGRPHAEDWHIVAASDLEAQIEAEYPGLIVEVEEALR